ncbi:MAG: glycosyltransferase [Bacteroidetes bacterium]|nr:glycosyltransferase [Bacteroidota bacterium]
MKFSIITPVKNLETYISETIESVIMQRGDFEIEYIIADGASDDNTLNICREYQNQIKNKSRPIHCNSIDFKIISENDNSMYEALSNALKITSGDIIAYINADDFYLPNAFSCINEVFSKFEQVKWATGLPLRYNEQGQNTNFHIPWQYRKNLILKGYYGKSLSFIQQESVFWKRELNENIYLEKLKHFMFAGDYFLWYSFAKSGTELYIIQSFLSGNRNRNIQKSENKTEYFKEFNSIKEKSNLWYWLNALILWLLEYLIGKYLKKRYSKNRIIFKKNQWVLK